MVKAENTLPFKTALTNIQEKSEGINEILVLGDPGEEPIFSL